MAWSIRMIVVLALGVALVGFAACTPANRSAASTDKLVFLSVLPEHAEEAKATLGTFGIESKISPDSKHIRVKATDQFHGNFILCAFRFNGQNLEGKPLIEVKDAQVQSLADGAYRVRLQDLLMEIIVRSPSVEMAALNISPPSRPYYYRFDREDIRAKASLMIETPYQQVLTRLEVYTFARLIMGADQDLSESLPNISDTSAQHYQIDSNYISRFSQRNRDEIRIRNLVARAMAPWLPRVAIFLEYDEAENLDLAASSIVFSITTNLEMSDAERAKHVKAVSDATKVPVENISILLVPPLER